MPENKVQITIEAVNKANAILADVGKGLQSLQKQGVLLYDQFNRPIDMEQNLRKVDAQAKSTTQTMGGLGGVLSSVKQNWLALSIGVNQFLEIVGKIGSAAAAVYNFVKEGQKVELVETAFRNMAGSVGADSEAMISRLKTITKGVMDDTDLMARATEMMLAGVKPDQIEKLTAAMAKMAPYAGMTLPEGMQRLGTALETGNARAIRAITGYIDLNYELDVYAQRLGKTADQLTDVARVQATAEIIQDRMNSKTKDLKATQELGINTFLRFESAWKNMIENMQKGLGPLAELLSLLTKIIDKMNEYSSREAQVKQETDARKKFAETAQGQAMLGAIGTSRGQGYEQAFQTWYAGEKQRAESQQAAKANAPAAGGGKETPTRKGATPLENLQKQQALIAAINDEEAKRKAALDVQMKMMGMQVKGISDQEMAEFKRNSLSKIENEFSAKRLMVQAEILKQRGFEIEALETQKNAELILTTNAEDRLALTKKWDEEIGNARLARETKLAESREKAEQDAESRATAHAQAESEGRLAIVETRIETEKVLNEQALRDGRISEEKSLQEQYRLDRELIEARIKQKEESKLVIPIEDTAAITKALSEIIVLREQLTQAREKEKGAYSEYDRRMELSWGEASLANLIARINRTRELNRLKVEAGEMRPGEARMADVALEQEQVRAEIALLDIQDKAESSDAKKVEYAQQRIRLQGQLHDAEMIRLRLLEETGTFEEGLLAGLKRYTNAAMTAFQEGIYLAQGAARAMEDSFGTLFFDAMQGKLKRGIDYWRQFVASIEKMLSDLLAKKLMEQIIGTQSQGAGGNYGGIIGMIVSYYSSSPSTASPQPGVYTGVANSGYEMATVGHGGKGPGETVSYRLVPSATFIGAPRFHTGKGGEMPAIIKEDESIFTPGQLRALGRAQKAGGGDTYITNNWNVSAIDAPSFRQFALRNKGTLADANRAAAKDNHPSRRGG